MRFYIRALSQLMDMDMDVSVPELCIDMGGAILTYPMSRWVIVSDEHTSHRKYIPYVRGNL